MELFPKRVVYTDMEAQKSDRALVEAAVNGDLQAFDKLVGRYQDRIYTLAFRLVGNAYDAEDCAQKTFIKAWQALPSFKRKSTFSTWLYRITVNTCYNHLKSLVQRMKAFMRSIHAPQKTEQGDIPFQLVDTQNATRQVLEGRDNERLIQQALDSLAPDKKSVLILRIEGFSYKEIVDLTGFTLGVVKKKIYRARVILKRKLKGILQNEYAKNPGSIVAIH